jgi:hypothetical protein
VGQLKFDIPPFPPFPVLPILQTIMQLSGRRKGETGRKTHEK